MYVHQPGLVSLSIGVLSTLAAGGPKRDAIAADSAAIEAVSECLFRRDLERIGEAAP